MEAQVPSPQNKKPSWKVWKICIKCGKKGHVKETCPNGNKNEVPDLDNSQIYHLGQNNNYDDKNTTQIKGANVDQLMERFQSLRPMSGSDSPTTAPTSPNHAMHPPEGPESANSEEEEGELRPSLVVSATEESAEEGELTSSPKTRRKKMAVAGKENRPCKIEKKCDENMSMANEIGAKKKSDENVLMANEIRAEKETDKTKSSIIRAETENEEDEPMTDAKPEK